MRALIVEHDHVSPPGAVGTALTAAGYEVDEFLVVPADRFDDPGVDVAFPSLDDYDAIVVMGAPWSVYDRDAVGSWVDPELHLLREAHRRDMPVLGICFGGQLLAAAHGGSVSRSPAPELGWHVVLSDEPDVVAPGPWFQWHSDRWSAPRSATAIARNAAAPQAFRLGRSLAVQFHPELDAPMLQGWLDNGGRSYLERCGLDVEVLVEHTRREQDAARDRAQRLVDAWLALHDGP